MNTNTIAISDFKVGTKFTANVESSESGSFENVAFEVIGTNEKYNTMLAKVTPNLNNEPDVLLQIKYRNMSKLISTNVPNFTINTSFNRSVTNLRFM